MSLPKILRDDLRLPVVGAPMLTVTMPDLAIAQCQAGILGSLSALNVRPEHVLELWLRICHARPE